MLYAAFVAKRYGTCVFSWLLVYEPDDCDIFFIVYGIFLTSFVLTGFNYLFQK